MKTIKNAVLILFFLTLSVSTALLAYLHFFAPDVDDLSGEWTANLNMAEPAAVAAYDWLQDIEAVYVSIEDIEAYMQDLTIQVNLTMEQTDGTEGTFRCNVSQESYEACRQAAYEAFAFAFQGIVAERLRMAGYIDGGGTEEIEALVTETFGMSTVSYLMSCVPELLPPLEDLQAGYDGSGTYEAAEGILIRHFDSGQPDSVEEEYCIGNDYGIILSEEAGSAHAGLFSDNFPLIYILIQTQNQ